MDGDSLDPSKLGPVSERVGETTFAGGSPAPTSAPVWPRSAHVELVADGDGARR